MMKSRMIVMMTGSQLLPVCQQCPWRLARLAASRENQLKPQVYPVLNLFPLSLEEERRILSSARVISGATTVKTKIVPIVKNSRNDNSYVTHSS